MAEQNSSTSTAAQQKGSSVLPTARVSKIVKSDKDIAICSKEALFLMSVATVRAPRTTPWKFNLWLKKQVNTGGIHQEAHSVKSPPGKVYQAQGHSVPGHRYVLHLFIQQLFSQTQC